MIFILLIVGTIHYNVTLHMFVLLIVDNFVYFTNIWMLGTYLCMNYLKILMQGKFFKIVCMKKRGMNISFMVKHDE